VGSIITLPIILNFGTISRRVVSFTPQERATDTQWMWVWVSPSANLDAAALGVKKNVSPANNWTTKPQSSILQPSQYHDYVIPAQVHNGKVWHKIRSPVAWACTIIKSFLVSISLARISDLRIMWMPNHFSVGTHTKN